MSKGFGPCREPSIVSVIRLVATERVLFDEGLLLFDLRQRRLHLELHGTRFDAAFLGGTSQLRYVEAGQRIGTLDLADEGLSTPGAALVGRVRAATGLSVIGGELRFAPDPLFARLGQVRARMAGPR